MTNDKTATIYDVAQKAGVSVATVSRLLNGSSNVAAEKREKILAAIEALHFVPKADAVAQARKQYRKIGVIAPFFTQPSFMERLRGVASVLAVEHYELVIYSIDTVDDLNTYISTLVAAKRVDGLIAFCLSLDASAISILKKAPFPVCFVENEVEGFDSVIVQNLQGGQSAAAFLYQKGVRRPGFIGEKSQYAYAVHATEERFRGFEFFFAGQGITLKGEHIWIGEFTDKKLDEGIEEFLNQKELPDGVFCSSDLIAARFMYLAQERGIRIPEDIQVIGFDNIDIAEYIGLTSVSQGLDESGRFAATLVLDHIQHPNRDEHRVLSTLKVIARQTTR